MIKKLHRTDYGNEELKTSFQWEKLKKVPISEENGLLLWVNYFHNEKKFYYTSEQVRDMTSQELEELKEKNREKRERYKKNAAEREKLRKAEEERSTNARIEYCVDRAVYSKGEELGAELIKFAHLMPYTPITSNMDLIVLDVETTGLSNITDEILQLSIIDGNNEILFNSYIKPYKNNRWEEAECVHGIKPTDVEEAPYPHEIIPLLKGILENVNMVVGYNVLFDIGFLEKWGLDFSKKSVYDVMTEFAPIYGEYDEYYGNYRWQKLQTCAEYYGYEFNAHDSLEDVKATLFCYNKMKEN